MPRANHKTERRNKPLNRLQEEGWQLKLIVSGIVTFLLIGLYPYLEAFGKYIPTTTMGSSQLTSLVAPL